MCGGFEYKPKGMDKTKKVYFPMPQAHIPYLGGDETEMAQWGRRQGEDVENLP